jgi:hypothetical protein
MAASRAGYCVGSHELRQVGLERSKGSFGARGPLSCQDVVDGSMCRNLQSAGDQVQVHPRYIVYAKPGPLHCEPDFIGSSEFPPLVRTSREKAQNVFAHDNRKCVAYCGTVDGGEDCKPARLHQCGAVLDKHVAISDVLSYLHGKYHVKALAGFSKSLRCRAPVVDLDACLVSVLCRYPDGVLRRINSNNLRAQLREWLAEHASATANIENPKAAKTIAACRVAPEPAAGGVSSIGHSHDIVFMQPASRATRIPPIGGNRVELRNFGIVDGGIDVRGHFHLLEIATNMGGPVPFLQIGVEDINAKRLDCWGTEQLATRRLGVQVRGACGASDAPYFRFIVLLAD